MQTNLLIFLTTVIFYAQAALATPVILEALPGVTVVGRGVMSYAFWEVYEATLYAPQGEWKATEPYALSIVYFRALEGKKIADRSVQEIRQQGFSDEVQLAAWNAQMKAIFPNVQKGTVLSAIYFPGLQTLFYSGNQIIGTIKGDGFGRLFFDIWLNEKTSQPSLRRALLGLP